MKLHHIALAAAALVSSQAFALNVSATVAAPVKLYITGSSALAAVIEGLLNQPGNCVSGTYTKYKGLAGSAAGSGDTTDGNSHTAYSCTLASGSDFGATFNGQNVAIIKRDAGGSAQGVFPLFTSGSAPSATVDMLDLSSCNDSTLTCNNTTPVVPDAGVSDLEPTAFNNVVNQPTAFAGQVVANSGFRSVTSVAEQVFALIANDKLYNDLVSLTGSASVPKAAFASVFASGYDSATLGWSTFARSTSSGSPTFLAGNTNQVNVCSRAIGSGTRATAQIQFLDLPYNKLAVAAATPTLSNTSGAVRGGNAPGAYFISEESSSGNVVSCVGAANGTNGYSIGIVGADRDLTGTGTHFLSIDNVAPGRAAGREGQYQWVYESFYNVSKKVASTSTTLFPNAFGAAFKLAKNINAVSAAAANGVMATPANCSATSAAWTGDELAACSRVSRNKDSRQPLTFAK